MTALADRPASATPGAPHPHGGTPHPNGGTRRPATSDATRLVALAALLVAAALPFARVYDGYDFVQPVAAAVLLSLGVSVCCRRAGAGPGASLAITAAAWALFTGVVFFRDTLAYGPLPGLETAAAFAALWERGIELVRIRPAPAYAEAGLLLITVTGVWAVVHCIEGLAFRLEAPVKAILMAMVLWAVPLAVAPADPAAWRSSVPFLAASAALLLAFAGADLARWGRWLPPTGVFGRTLHGRSPLLPSGALVAAVAIVAGVVLAGSLPGYGEAPWYQLRGGGGTTLTSNPMVTIRSDLVASDDRALLRVRTPRPLYLRLTALDRYSAREEWTNDGIRGVPLDGREVPLADPLGASEPVQAEVRVVGLDGAVLVPAPYQPVAVQGASAGAFLYDSRLSTLTVSRGELLREGSSYAVAAAIPQPDPAVAAAVDNRAPGDPLTALPGNVPDSVGALARDIVDAAGAGSPFEDALAIQEELRTWQYSLDPPPGHGSTAMEAFIERRVGYCEQYAGTMAVMLRTLDIPARVAVGFSPGSPVGEVGGDGMQEYVVSQANAHAWVEVLFPGLGWVAFEPTPRSDGNVIVPSAAELFPSSTAAQQPSQSDGGAADIPQIPGREEQAPSLTEQEQEAEREAAATAGDTPGGGDSRGPATTLLLVAALGGATGVALLARRRRQPVPSDPSSRVEVTRSRLARLARGLGSPPDPSDTDREWLARLGAGSPAALRLAEAAGRGRYAAEVPVEVADEAERAGAALERELLAGRGPLGRALVRFRGGLASGRARVTVLGGALLRRLPDRPEPRRAVRSGRVGRR